MGYGDCIVTLVRAAGADAEHLVVRQADPVVLATNEIIEEWRAGTSHVQIDGDVVAFGTEGQGLGRVSYRIGGRYDQYTHVLTRVS